MNFIYSMLLIIILILVIIIYYNAVVTKNYKLFKSLSTFLIGLLLFEILFMLYITINNKSLCDISKQLFCAQKK